ncbi:flavin-containing monooxygenase [Nocardioides sp. NPDC051685]|uniref:flavin-containing monooxygenase n=1 Tax=Nocardioides sp. NPDC051685 TaxID=3364334 RepID=UPI0037AE34E3
MTSTSLGANVDLWFQDFGRALDARDESALRELFADPSYLRDNGALTWDFRQFHGRESVIAALLSVVDEIKPSNFALSANWPAPSILGEGDAAVVEAFYDFETADGTGVALLNGALDDSAPHGFRVRALYTRLESLKDAPRPEVHPRGSGFTPTRLGQTYGEFRAERCEFVDSDPEVIVVGAGQAGLVAAAHLGKLGVRTLIVDRNESVGDNWRNRYDSLTLHNPVEMNGFPFLEFPSHYPEYLPKDVMGDWLDVYARYLDLDIWTSTEFRGAEYDEATGQWTATMVRADSTERVLRPKHVILATGGIGGKPSIPDLPGLSTFDGPVMHSSKFTSATDYDIKKAIIIGAATSAHDIALDMYENGVEVTMVQRSAVVVNHVDTANLAYAGYIDPEIPTELVDIRYGIGLIDPLRAAASRQYHAYAKELDADLLKGLEAAGMRLGDGVNGMGWLDLFLRTGGGYYLNKGASEVIVEGGIKVMQFDGVVEFVENGAKLDDGTVLEADIVVLATGYQNRKVEVAEWFGEDVAERVGDIACLDDQGEWANLWGQTGQRGLWLNGGGINQIRPGSERLALLVKADLEGLITDAFRHPAANAQPAAVGA